MQQIELRTIGSDNNPIKIYWNIRNNKVDEYLLIMSITSGVYGLEHYDLSVFKEVTALFISKARSFEKYQNQLFYILSNTDENCAIYLNNKIYEKWGIEITFTNHAKIEA